MDDFAGNLRFMQGKSGSRRMNLLLQRLLKEWFAAHPDEKEAEFARRAGVTKAAINNIKNKASGGGTKAVEAVAKAMGRPYWELYRMEWMERTASPRPVTVDAGDEANMLPIPTKVRASTAVHPKEVSPQLPIGELATPAVKQPGSPRRRRAGA